MQEKRIIRVGDIVLDNDDKREVQEVLASSRLSEGPKVREFEKQWAHYIGTKQAICTSSGFGALMVALAALKYNYNLPDGTEVITSPCTYFADFSALYWLRFSPIFIDITQHNFCLDEAKLKDYLLKNKAGAKKRILLTIDLFGYMNNIDNIRNLCQENNLIFLEDAAEAHGSVYKGHKAGSQAEMSIFSFYIAHNIQVGEMGAINTNNNNLAELCRSLKAQGRNCTCKVCTRGNGICPRKDDHDGQLDLDPRFTHSRMGFNFKTTEFQAAIGLSQLNKAEAILQKRLANVKYLNEGLKKYSNYFILPAYDSSVSYLAYPLILKDNKSFKRKWFCEQLAQYGIESRSIFACIPNQQPAAKPMFLNLYLDKLPTADFVGANGFYLGCHQFLSRADLDHIIDSFGKILEKIK